MNRTTLLAAASITVGAGGIAAVVLGATGDDDGAPAESPCVQDVVYWAQRLLDEGGGSDELIEEMAADIVIGGPEYEAAFSIPVGIEELAASEGAEAGTAELERRARLACELIG